MSSYDDDNDTVGAICGFLIIILLITLVVALGASNTAYPGNL